MASLNRRAQNNDLIVSGIFYWLILSSLLAWGLWHWFGPAEFFFVWGLSGLAGVCAVNFDGLRKRKTFRNLSDKQMAGFHSVNVAFHMAIGPSIIVARVLELVGYLLNKYSGDTSSPSQTT